MISNERGLDVLIVGGGPAGLAAAIAARQRGLSYLVLEKAALCNSLLHYPAHMVFFTTPELMEIGGMPFTTPYEKPTRVEALRYYRRVTDAHQLDVRLGEPVRRLERVGDGFRIESEQLASGAPHAWRARSVVIASGAYDLPNRINVPGEDLPHVSHYYREAHPHYRQRVVIVGGKNSAAEAALEIHRAGAARVTLVHRGAGLGDSIKYWVKPDIENRIAEGSVQAFFNTHLTEITLADVALTDGQRTWREPADAVLLMTGYRSDPLLLRQVGAAVDESTGAPVHDETTFETTIPHLYVIGACVAGKQSGRIFIENGRFHGAVVIAEIAKRQGTTR